MKNYSLRINLVFQESSDINAARLAEFLLKEMPRAEGVSIKDTSLFNASDKKQLVTK